jgi:4'-phosphopantetheinyl transferase
VDERTIKVWSGDFTATEASHKRYWLVLDQSEQRHASSIKNEKVLYRYVEGRARLKILLGDVLNTFPNQLRLEIAEYGKPYLVDYPQLSFNISHSANSLTIAVAYECDLGIDIEQCKARANLSGLVDKCFAEEEQNYWQQLSEMEQTQAFYQFWTSKEAFVKATGRGFALGLNRCIIDPLKPSGFLSIPEGYGEANQWFIWNIELGETLCGTLVAKSKTINHSKSRSVYLHSLND